MNHTKTFLAATLLGASLPAAAVNIGDLGLSESQIKALNAQLTAPATAPGFSFGSPVGFGASWGEAFGGIGGNTTPPKKGDDLDGSMSLGMGFGDAYDGIGVEGVVTLISMKDEFGEDGDWHLKAHHALENRGSFAIGVEGLAGWGAAEDKNTSTYAVYTQVVDLAPEIAANQIPLAINIGLGEGRFADVGDDVGVFGSLAVYPLRQFSLIADWTGRDANAAVSFVPVRKLPITVTLGFVNLGERYADTEFAGGVGYLLRF